MGSDVAIAPADGLDYDAVSALLGEVKLPSEDIDPALPDFLVARVDGRIVGCVGLEVKGDAALLRSLAVSPALQSRGLGDSLLRHITEHARARGVRELFLLTTTAQPFFSSRGFARATRDEAPPGIRSTQEFRSCCPSSAVCMRRWIDSTEPCPLPPSPPVH